MPATMVFFETSDEVAAAAATLLLEGGRTYQIDKRWSFRSDRPHTTGMQQHNHILFKGNEVAVINKDCE
jgi:hypothetical protein